MQEVDLKTAEAEPHQILQAALTGEEIVITKDDEPVLRLVPVNGIRRRAGSAKGKILISEDFDEPLENFTEYME